MDKPKMENRMLLEMLRMEYGLSFYDIRRMTVQNDKIWYRYPDCDEREEVADVDFSVSDVPKLKWKGRFESYNKGRHLRVVRKDQL